MVKMVRWALALGAVLLISPSLAVSGEKDEIVPNPMYKYWANHKAGATATLVEKTVFPGADKDELPDGREEKRITYKLLAVTPLNVVVQVTVREREFLGDIESAPTKAIYRAKIRKSHLLAGFSEFAIDTKKGEETITVGGKSIACKTISGTQKKGNSVVEQKMWYSEAVPGGVVKRHRVAKLDGKVTAETTIEVVSHKKAK